MEMRAALDTGVFRDDSALAQFLGNCEVVWIPMMVLGEKPVFDGGTQRLRNETLIRKSLHARLAEQ